MTNMNKRVFLGALLMYACVSVGCGGESSLPTATPTHMCDPSTGDVTIEGPIEGAVVCYESTWLRWSGANLVEPISETCGLVTPARPVPEGETWDLNVRTTDGNVCPSSVTPVVLEAPAMCGWPMTGTFTVPALPEGFDCWEARVAEPDKLVIIDRDNPHSCNLEYAGCVVEACHTISGLAPGDLVDTYGSPPEMLTKPWLNFIAQKGCAE